MDMILHLKPCLLLESISVLNLFMQLQQGFAFIRSSQSLVVDGGGGGDAVVVLRRYTYWVPSSPHLNRHTLTHTHKVDTHAHTHTHTHTHTHNAPNTHITQRTSHT